MFSQQFVVKNPTGLHARPASQLAKLCKSLPDEVRLITEKGAVNPKNVLGILTAGLKNGSQFTVQVEGESEQDSGRQIMEFLEGLSE
ncbi:MAG: HPr family phosphocarrier protein [Butyricicoccus pullicaecorum]|nr:HPr family phosphocarrier protein [Butyricicoccus pullicaecorum]